MLLLFIVWLLADPYAEPTIVIVRNGIGAANVHATLGQLLIEVGRLRVWCIGIAAGLLIALSSLCTTLVVVRQRYSLRQLLTGTALIGAWCAAIVGAQQITWTGKRFRAASRLNSLDRLAESLESDWPKSDGEIEGLGPFNAYPAVRPSVLLLLTPYPLPGTQTVVAAIERSPNGILRFQLGGEDGGDWIEWHGGASRPRSFTGGLQEDYQLQQFSPIAPDWYLVRYSDPSHHPG
ncbi:hypothetical protein ACMFWY_22895 [Roseiconus sp. JC912]